jgi:hypothetical protein
MFEKVISPRIQAVVGVVLCLAALAPLAAHAGNNSDVAPLVKPPVVPPPVVQGCTGSVNDDCADAIAITSVPFTDNRDTTCTTDEVGEPQSTCTLQANSIWYTYSNPAQFAQIVTISLEGSDFDTAIMVYTGTCGAFTPLACNDDAIGFQSVVSFVADPGVVYYIQVGGFNGDTGNLVFNLTAEGGRCAPTDITGVLGSGSPDYPSVSGNQTGRLNRNGIGSTCAAPKTCNIFTPTDPRPFDAYTIPNDSDNDVCVSVSLEVLDQAGCNLQSNIYLDAFDPANICTDYLGDPGLSSGSPPTPTSFTSVVPAGQSAVVVVHSVDIAAGTGCNYHLLVLGDICRVNRDWVEIPALSTYGLGALALLLAGAGIALMRRSG